VELKNIKIILRLFFTISILLISHWSSKHALS
jgi:hypothetical protein